MKWSWLGMNVGQIAGSILFLNFTIIAQPARWMLTRFSAGQSIAIYGEIGILWIVACAIVGGLLPNIFRGRGKSA